MHRGGTILCVLGCKILLEDSRPVHQILITNATQAQASLVAEQGPHLAWRILDPFANARRFVNLSANGVLKSGRHGRREPVEWARKENMKVNTAGNGVHSWNCRESKGYTQDGCK